MRYLTRLSPVQWIWLIGTCAVAIVIVAFGWGRERGAESPSGNSFTVQASIREIAPELGVTGKALARELGLPLDVPKGRPLAKLGVSQDELDHATAHLLSHHPSGLKYYVYAALVLFGLVFLTRLGRPRLASDAERDVWYPRAPYVAALVVAVVVCGFFLGKAPNPMEGVVKVFKSMVGLYPSVTEKVLGFVFFLALAVVGNKLICGWGCPFGALQELVYSLPLFRRIKRHKVPFWISNGIRASLFVVVLLLLFGVVGGREGLVLYHYINPFNLFDLDFDYASLVAVVALSLGLGLAVYRPFCQFICPFGLVSWIAERVSLTGVHVDAERCNECGACARACPLDAARDKVAGKLFGADCYSCARCLNVCPQDAIRYESVFAGSRPVDGPASDEPQTAGVAQ
jgi:ferredoxin